MSLLLEEGSRTFATISTHPTAGALIEAWSYSQYSNSRSLIFNLFISVVSYIISNIII